MDLKCPKCGSHDIVKASLAYAANTSQHQSLTKGAGIGTGGIGVGLGTTSGTSQTLLAQRVAPPTGSATAGCAAMPVTALVLWFCYSVGAPWWVWVIVGIVTFGLFIPLMDRENEDNQKLLREYDRKWLCQRCGHIATI